MPQEPTTGVVLLELCLSVFGSKLALPRGMCRVSGKQEWVALHPCSESSLSSRGIPRLLQGNRQQQRY